MSKFSRSALAASAGVLLVGASACAMPGESGESEGSDTSGEAQQAKALEGFDPCTFFQPEELESRGISTEAEEFAPLPSEPGCQWTGDDTIVSLQKNVEQTVDSYGQSGSWESYEKEPIAGRSGAIAQTSGASSAGVGCNILVDAGGGVAIYQVTGKATTPIDACGEAEKIASETASRLPE